MSFNLAESYAALVKIRPEMAVTHATSPDTRLEPTSPGLWAWVYYVFGRGGITSESAHRHDWEVAPLILARLLAGLPEGFCLAKTRMTSGRDAWLIAKDMDDSISACVVDTPLEALFAFYLATK